ncbi:MAG: hypothetical protein AAF198_08855 [Pseudomonadota bacterium]
MTERPVISQDATRKARQSRKRQEVALLIPLFGAIILFTPLLGSLGIGGDSLKSRFVSLFLIWLGLIIASFIMRRMLRPDMRGDD